MADETPIDDRRANELRATAIVEMFLGFGAEATDERVSYYLRLLGSIAPALLREACDAAVLADTSGFIPAPGVIYQQAKRIQGQRLVEARERAKQARFEAERDAILRRIRDDQERPAEISAGEDRPTVEQIIERISCAKAFPVKRPERVRRPALRVVNGEIVECETKTGGK